MLHDYILNVLVLLLLRGNESYLMEPSGKFRLHVFFAGTTFYNLLDLCNMLYFTTSPHVLPHSIKSNKTIVD